MSDAAGFLRLKLSFRAFRPDLSSQHLTEPAPVSSSQGRRVTNQPLLSYRMAMACPSWDWASGKQNVEVITAIQKR